MPAPWNDSTDKQLLLAVIQLTAPAPPKWDQVAAMMGEGYTAESTRQHYAKLKKEVAKQAGGDAAGLDTPKKTPAKRGKKAKDEDGDVEATPRSSMKRKAKKDVSYDEEDDEESPTKKVKAEAAEEEEADEV